MVEHRTLNPQAEGSSPSALTRFTSFGHAPLRVAPSAAAQLLPRRPSFQAARVQVERAEQQPRVVAAARPVLNVARDRLGPVSARSLERWRGASAGPPDGEDHYVGPAGVDAVVEMPACLK